MKGIFWQKFISQNIVLSIKNLFAKIKRFNRVHVRRYKLIVSYLGLIYLAFMKII